MPDEATTENGNDTEITSTLPADDWFLQMRVGIANQGTTIGITLNVRGALISGTLASGRDYFEAVARGLGDAQGRAHGEEVGQGLENALRKLMDVYPDPDEEARDDEQEGSGPNYIHFRGAHIYEPAGGSIPRQGEVWWRGRLCCVDGFILGELSRQE